MNVDSGGPLSKKSGKISVYAWLFVTRHEKWYWCHTNDDDTVTDSGKGFASLDVCAQDAQMHGCSHKQALQAKTRAVSPDTTPQKIFIYPKAAEQA
jgi:hypothetical protein